MAKIRKIMALLILGFLVFSCGDGTPIDQGVQLKRNDFVVGNENIFDFEVQAEGSRVVSFEVVNVLDQDITISSILIDHAEFEILNSDNIAFESFDIIIPAGGKIDIIVKYNPIDQLDDSAMIVVAFTGNKSGETGAIEFPIQASYGVTIIEGKGNSGLDVSGDIRFYDFQAIFVGSLKEKPITVTNVTSHDVVITSCSFIDGLYDFSFSGISLPQVVKVGEDLDFYLIFEPTDEAKQIDTFQLYTEDGNFDIELRGEGQISSQPVIKIYGPNGLEVEDLLNIPNIKQNSTGEAQEFKIKNLGGTTLEVFNITSTRPIIFAIDTGTTFDSDATLSLSRNAEYTFSILFSPDVVIQYESLISIPNNSSDEFVSFTVVAEGLDPTLPEIEFFYDDSYYQNGAAIKLGSTNINQSLSKNFFIKNAGGINLTISAISIDNPKFSVVDDGGIVISFPFDILAESEFEGQFIFESATVDTFETKITINSNDTDEATFELDLSALCTSNLPLKKPEFKAGQLNWYSDNLTAPTWEWQTPVGSSGNGIFKFRLDEGDFQDETSALTYTPELALAEGEHTLYIAEKNDEGSWSLENGFIIDCDYTVTDPPVITYTPDYQKAGVNYAGTATPLLSWNPADADDYSKYRYRLDGATEWIETSSNSALLSAMDDGLHLIEIQTQDKYERWSSSLSYDLTVDTTGPVIALNGPEDLLLPKGALFVDFNQGAIPTDDNLDSTAVEVDDSGIDVNNDGAIYQVSYTSEDELGNVGEKICRVYVVDLTKLNLVVEKNSLSNVIEGGTDLTFIVSGLDSILQSQVAYQWSTSPQDTALPVIGFTNQAPAIAGENLVQSVGYENPTEPKAAVMNITLTATAIATTVDYDSNNTYTLYPDSSSIIKNPGFEGFSGTFVEFNKEGVNYPDYLTNNVVDAWVDWGFSHLVFFETGSWAVNPNGNYPESMTHFGFGTSIITDTGFGDSERCGEVVSTLAKGAYPRTGNYCAVVGDFNTTDLSRDISDIKGFIFKQINLIPGITYEMSVWVYSEANLAPDTNATDPRDCIWLGVFDNNDIQNELVLGTPAQNLPTGPAWQKITVQFAASQISTRVAIEMSWSSQGGLGTPKGHQGYRFDDFEINYVQ